MPTPKNDKNKDLENEAIAEEIKEEIKKDQLQTEQIKAQAKKKHAWMSPDENYTFSFLGKVSPEAFKEVLDKLNVKKYAETQDGFNVETENGQMHFDLKNNTITIDNLNRETFKQLVEIAGGANIHAFDLSSLAGQLKGKDDHTTLYNVYAGIKDGGKDITIKGLDSELLSKFEAQYNEEIKTATMSPKMT